MHRSLLLLLLLVATPVAAQQTDTGKLPTGVRLGLTYRAGFRPKIAVRPFTGDATAFSIATEAHDILRRDLDYSDRFVMGDLPSALTTGKVNYKALDDLDFVFLVTAEVNPAPGGFQVRFALHDVVYSRVKQEGTFMLPSATGPGFRMAVHAAADELVRWATGQPGMAASRIVFVRRGQGRASELMTVDSDGENLQRIASFDAAVVSPAWSPDGQRVAFSVLNGSTWELRERELESGRARTLSARPGINFTPAYSPDGQRLAFAMTSGTSLEIHEMELSGGSPRRITRSPRDDLSPSYSPDGQRIAFNANRIGQPHIYLSSVAGGEATLLSPYTHGEPGYYTSPDWQPTGSLVAFHGRSRGNFQIMVADATKPGETVQQLTADGENEDPSWAPDGRHLVFSGVRPEGSGLYVIDTATGRIRPLTSGRDLRVPDWSPALLKASALAARGGG